MKVLATLTAAASVFGFASVAQAYDMIQLSGTTPEAHDCTVILEVEGDNNVRGFTIEGMVKQYNLFRPDGAISPNSRLVPSTVDFSSRNFASYHFQRVGNTATSKDVILHGGARTGGWREQIESTTVKLHVYGPARAPRLVKLHTDVKNWQFFVISAQDIECHLY